MKITVITPVFNREDSIGDCMRSIAAQSLPCEHIIVDGGSTDGTLEIIQQNRTSKTHVISEPDQGMYDAINKGIENATGDITGILNSDDIYADNQVLERIQEVFSDSSVDACYGDLIYVDNKNTNKVRRNWRAGEFDRKKFYAGWMPPHPTFYLRRSVYEKYGGYRLDCGSAADYELMLRLLLKHELVAEYIPKVLVKMRSGGMSNASLNNRIKAHRNDRKAWQVNGLKPYPWTLAGKPLRKMGQWIFKT